MRFFFLYIYIYYLQDRERKRETERFCSVVGELVFKIFGLAFNGFL